MGVGQIDKLTPSVPQQTNLSTKHLSNMTLLIAEDEALHADRFELLAQQMGYEVAGVFDNAFDALDAFHRCQPDVLLLDIHLRGDIDGVQLAERINQIRSVPIVFVTSMQDDKTFARANQTRPVAFILKPFDALQLQRAIELAVGRLSPAAHEQHFEQHDLVLPDCFFVKVRERLEKVNFNDILYLEADGHYSNIHTTYGRKFVLRMPLGELEALLPSGQFARIHRSYLVQLGSLQSIDLQNMMVLMKDKSLPLSKGFRDQILQRIKQI